jgi:hypothetical protein
MRFAESEESLFSCAVKMQKAVIFSLEWLKLEMGLVEIKLFFKLFFENLNFFLEMYNNKTV